MKIGLKLWSPDADLIGRSAELAENGVFDYLELYVVPGSNSTIEKWKELDPPIILHAPHSLGGLNMAEPNIVKVKRSIFAEIEEFRRELNSEFVIFHPGVDGELARAAANFADLRSEFPALANAALIENKPLLGMNGETCVGYAPADIAELRDAVGCGVCLDFGHAIAAANSMGKSWEGVVGEFLKMKPSVFHLSDGDAAAEMDAHLNLGNGNYPLPEIAAMIPAGAMVTLETAKDADRRLEDFEDDVFRFLGHVYGLRGDFHLRPARSADSEAV